MHQKGLLGAILYTKNDRFNLPRQALDKHMIGNAERRGAVSVGLSGRPPFELRTVGDFESVVRKNDLFESHLYF